MSSTFSDPPALDQVSLRMAFMLFPFSCFSLTIRCQDLGARRNIESILGSRPLFWCWPSRTPGNGLRYELSNRDSKWQELSSLRIRERETEDIGRLA